MINFCRRVSMKTTGLIPALFLLLASSLHAGDSQDEKDLRLAASIGDVETVAQLLDKGVPVDSASKVGKNALMMAVENDNFETVVLLLNRGADVNSRTVAGCTALTFAAENGHPALTAMLLERGAHLHDRTRSGWDALMIASATVSPIWLNSCCSKALIPRPLTSTAEMP
jgi:ankyrin repeat protein